MAELLTVLLVSLLWGVLVGELNVFNLLVGAVLGLVLLGIVQRGKQRSFARRLWAFARFLVSFARELVVANVLVALLAFTPHPRFQPHVIAVPLRLKSDLAITLLAATITLLPGTVAMEISEDRGTLYAHSIGADVETARAGIRRFERLILGFML